MAVDTPRERPTLPYRGAMPEQLPPAVARVVTAAENEQRALGHARIGTEHLLLGLLADSACRSAELLTAAGVSMLAARHMVAEVVVTEPGSGPSEGTDLTPRSVRALDRAGRFARRERAADVTDGHLLLGVLDVEGLACQVLRRLGVDLAGLRRAASGDHAAEAIAPDPRDADERGSDAAAVPDQPTIPTARPSCRSCGAPLAASLLVTAVAATDADGHRIAVRVVHCGECGASLGVLS